MKNIVKVFIGPVASIKIYFEGTKFFPHKEWDETSARGPRAGVGFLGMGQRVPSPPARGFGERCKLPQRGKKFEIWCNLRPQNSLGAYRNALYCVNCYRKAKTLRGEKTLSPR